MPIAEAVRQFVLNHTSPQRPPLVPEIHLHLGDDPLALWKLSVKHAANPEASLPFWAFAWPGGQAVARYLLDNPDYVQGKRVVDLGTGSGICAIAARLAGASYVLAVDIDPYSEAAVYLNSAANGAEVEFVRGDILSVEFAPPDVVLTGDAYYESKLTGLLLTRLRSLPLTRTRVILGDAHRGYLPAHELQLLMEYEVPVPPQLEDRDIKRACVYTLPRQSFP